MFIRKLETQMSKAIKPPWLFGNVAEFRSSGDISKIFNAYTHVYEFKYTQSHQDVCWRHCVTRMGFTWQKVFRRASIREVIRACAFPGAWMTSGWPLAGQLPFSVCVCVCVCVSQNVPKSQVHNGPTMHVKIQRRSFGRRSHLRCDVKLVFFRRRLK